MMPIDDSAAAGAPFKTQPVQPSDRSRGCIRIPVASMSLFPPSKAVLKVILRG
ncbi:hypothetical protein [Trinickia mobilis]|uniref:hypothetical protein n=1 Tax=Trinickia mobilis TaxID=2816356 RepID=UPI001A8D50BE|nr:hypothetical protein [Trinickia mobilis]